MTRGIVFVVFLSISAIIFEAESFLPNSIGSIGNKGDYTLEGITRRAIINVTEAFLRQQEPSSWSNVSTPLSITEQSLFRNYYGGQVSPKSFSANILSIATSAAKFCRTGSPASLFLNEKIVDGLILVQSLRRDLEKTIQGKMTDEDFTLARDLIGSIICTQSAFYSNTNWVEQTQTEVYSQLGVVSEELIHIADQTLTTCIDCQTLNGSLICTSNLLPDVGLTSGYITDKPDGKCGYGGILDADNESPPNGGINKATSDPELSPHYHLHQAAGQIAVQSLIELFTNPDNGILDMIDEDNFIELFGLGTGLTLSIVMDTTGSMWDDIRAVIAQTEKLISLRSGGVHLPEKFIFVPFADPEIGPVQVFSNSSEFLHRLMSVSPEGGDDCPELAMTGILQALQTTPPFSEIFIFTDAAAKDGSLANEVMALAMSKRIVLQFILTGECPEDETEYPDLYNTVAEKTGGNVYHSSKSDIGEAAGIIDLLSGADQVSILKFVTDGTRDYTIPVDRSIRDLTVFVSSDVGTYLPGMTLYPPTGPPKGSDIQTTNLVAYDIKNATTGAWRLHLDSPVAGLKVEVEGSSSLNVHLQLYEDDDNGILFPVNGEPITGENVTFGVTVLTDDEYVNFTSLSLISKTGEVISQMPVTATDNFLSVTSTVPDEGFRVLLTGSDSEGNDVYRLVEDFYDPQTFRLQVNQPSPLIVSPGGVLELPYSILTAGPGNENFTVRLTDRLGIFNATFHISGNGTGVLRIQIPRINESSITEDSVLSLLLSTFSEDESAVFYTNLQLLIKNTSEISNSTVKAVYILPTTPATTTTTTLLTTSSTPPSTNSTPSTGETQASVADDTAVIAGAVSGVLGLSAIATVILIKKYSRRCFKVSPYSYPKPKPTAAKPSLRPNFVY